ncbi:MAG: ABC transporter, permease protein 2 (cluster 4, leucine/isoleucine/valine/benzoate) [Olavius algarvensis Delta 4 endosymbiont]|nr:MAG: ABC transporter, permease protein 2 (cluster 4, leucine/isoleucine/valine/benzoate) [Olavius algarvensis Delta 4 endosymbiont]
MEANNIKAGAKRGKLIGIVWDLIETVPTLGWLFGALAAVFAEYLFGNLVALVVGLPKIPVLFGTLIVLKKPLFIPSAFIYMFLIYILPIYLVTRFSRGPANRLATKLDNLPISISTIVHLLLLYGALFLWADLSDYRILVAKLIMIAIILTLSINVINGYMGEFSCSHPGFMALGAYGSSTMTLLLFTDDKLFGPALLPVALGPWCFPLALIVGGLVASLGALVVAIPSFRTRGDYLAIISLAFMFIVKSAIENTEFVGGPRGMSSQPNWSTLPVVFTWTVLCIWVINNFVRSTMGKALNAVRDNEMAANAMTVNTRRTKMATFMFAAFWAGIAGGLFAHVLRYVNPSTFGVQKLAEILAMVYFGGLNSVVGSIVGAVSINLLSEALRPLELFKWIIIPLLLIFVMIYRPTGLIAFREFDVKKLLKPKNSSRSK